MTSARVFATGLMILSLGFALGACRQGEQGRPLMYDKGVYEGKADNEPSAAALDNARERAWNQRGF